MINNIKEKEIYKISSIAAKALLYEVSASPKPGLVDRNDSGAHKDMDFFTFIDSSVSLNYYFYKVTEAGYCFEGEDLKELFESIRPLGMEAEEDMFKATKGVNTHKGLIFSLGIIFCGAGYLKGKGAEMSVENLSKTASVMTKGVSEKDFMKISVEKRQTNGEKLFVKYGIKGIRAEAEGGFRTAVDWGYPELLRCINKGWNFNAACINALLKIMTGLNDTNILHRQDFDTLEYVKLSAEKTLGFGGAGTFEGVKYLEKLNHEFIEKNISPGGAADILAVTIALYFLSTMD